MSFADVLRGIRAVLDVKLFEVSGTTITVATAFSVALIVVLTLWLSRLARRGVKRVFARRGVDDSSTGTVAAFLHYIILVSGFGVALQTAGIDLGALFAAGAIFAIGLGFAMQNIAQNFVSGVILLAERAIKPGDVVEIESTVVRVLRMGIRATIVETRDGEDLIVPNSVLAQSPVKNYTYEQSHYRLRTVVGVTYGSDMKEVRQVLERVARDVEWRLPEPAPQVLLLEFGDSSVNWEVAVWMDDPWRSRLVLSRLNEAIWWAFREAEITIAFPQLDVHLDPHVDSGLRKLAVLGAAGEAS
jgi:small-conductance mechanosensitive channel